MHQHNVETLLLLLLCPAFRSKFIKMFPKERTFLNKIQLKEAIKVFLKHWNLLCKSNSSSIYCSYSYVTAVKKTCEVITDTNKRRQSNNLSFPNQISIQD